MTQPTVRARLLASSMITGVAVAALSAGAAFAQDASAPTDTNGTSVQEFVVTGSRIPSANLTSVSPVTTVNSQDVKLQGTTNVEDLINNLPQAFADFGQFESNGSSGTATVDLRGLGDTRTLVLIDGKRLQPGDPTAPVADINFIPPSLIDRVEVLTGGASAVYGSDAIAGVVNFIMKKNFEGLQIDAETSIGEHGNGNQQVRNANRFGANSFGFSPLNLPSGTAWAGQRHTVTITGGANSPDGKGNVEFYLGYTSIDPVLEGKYDWSACGLSTNTSNTKQQYCGGSVTSAGKAGGLLTPLTGPNAGGPPGSYFGLGYEVTGTPVIGPNGYPVLPGYQARDTYNFAPLNYIQRPDTRYTAGEYSHYEINSAIDLYSSFMFMDDHTVAQVAGSGSFYGDNSFTIPCNDPLLNTAQANTLCGPGPYTAGQSGLAAIGRRDTEGTGRTSDITHMDYRIVFGSKGDLGDGWSYDVSMQYGRSMLTDIEGGYFLNSKLQNALDVVPGANGPVCAVGGSCVPYNIWSPNGVTQKQLNYLEGTSINSGYTSEQVVTGSLSGDLGHYGIKSPLATDGVGISFGAEYRREFLQFTPDAAAEGGDLAGFGGSLGFTQGSQSDKDVFTELRVPLIQDVPFFKELTFEGGYRYSNYTSGGGNSSYKAGADWQIVPDLRLRVSYERATRAPNVDELFGPQTPGLIAGTDPCAGSNPGFTAAQCYNTFKNSLPANVSEAQYAATYYGNAVVPQCISSQCGDLSGGNPNLKSETGKTLSFGAVITPSFFKNFSFSIDYFKIDVDNAIVTPSLESIFNGCALSDIGCENIVRNPALNYAIYGGSGAGYVVTTFENAASLKTSGFDIDSSYRIPLSDMHLPDLGSLGFHFEGTYLHDLKTSLVGLPTYDCAGLYGVTCGTPSPKWRHQFRVSWSTPWNVQFSVNWRYLSATSLDFNTNQVSLQDNGFKDLLPTDARIPDFSYFDLAFTWKVKDRYTFRGGVNNIFDRTPPLLDSNSFGIAAPAFGNGNTYPQVFDPLGRVLFLGVTADF